ncbi:MAG: hypothetical protein KDC44_14900 [Phaeodactylibacter sp.]|nr:hypothetical protein [Phaeodactylibacter sp.]
MKLGAGTTFQFGIPDSDAIEAWHPGFQLLEDWSYFDSPELKSIFLRWFGKMESVRKTQWTVHYRLE